MNCSSSRRANMNKENGTAAKVEEPPARVTRSRAKALGGLLPSSKPFFKQDQKRVLQTNSKRAATDENRTSVAAGAGLQHKRRAVLKDVTNFCRNSHVNFTKETKIQPNKQARRGAENRDAKVASEVSVKIEVAQEDVKTKLAEELSKIRVVESHEVPSAVKLEENEPVEQCMSYSTREYDVADQMPLIQAPPKPDQFQGTQKKEDDKVCEKLGTSNGLGIVDIDSNTKDLVVCSLYAPDIYNNIRVTELDRRLSTNYMETMQQDITPNMRGILIDWLVEVSEEYRLVPDTLYLTVNLIDRFLSQNYIEKQRLQLLGVTCMLIASKYEEICAPRVEEFCIITDNTYTREEVLKMESQILNFLHFQLTVPTTKTFLRRFIQAAQTSYKAPCIKLEFLANYLAELTLTEYSFLNFIPSIVAASAVFLARWTLNQSDHPWNPTLEHYTSYTALELKTTVLALEDLQLNTCGCTLNAIREKYRQHKFNCVATCTSPESVGSLF